ncbi:MAG: glutamate synthase large subunit [Propionibacteriaceae bacterium]|jgi:glutamate synthase (NADPH/NADH) large chain|nr:glutamate synthase large subunit [Propionibacteriaceae bacterium]
MVEAGRTIAAQGLYSPDHEHEACGVGFVTRLDGAQTHQIVEQALTVLANLDHRGATGADPEAGDGAGLLVQVPDAFLRRVCPFELPAAGRYAVGLAFLPTDPPARDRAKAEFARLAAGEGLHVIGWRPTPINPSTLSPISLAVMPGFEQVFLSAYGGQSGLDLDRLVYPLRRQAERDLDIYFPSLSARTLVYKGMLTTSQLETFFPDLHQPDFVSALGLVHSRFSTNTFPSWRLAHPYRLIAHNGEINTVTGNRNWMRARQARLASDLIAGDMARLFPICTPGGSDSASFDEVLELLHLSGRSLAHAMLMMIPQAWQGDDGLEADLAAFYQYQACLMEPWDGPAAVAFTDGNQIGATLDRNGLRPARYWVTHDGLVVFASEAGVLDIPPDQIESKGRLQPGRMFLVDLAQHRILDDSQVKRALAQGQPYADWVERNTINLDDLPERQHIVHSHSSVTRRQQVFGYTTEELRLLVAPMANSGAEPIGSMGNDAPIAALSPRPRLLFDYFTQLFAQVTNPPLDAIREELVTSLSSSIGPEGNLLQPSPESCRQIVIPFPILDSDQLAKIVRIHHDGGASGYRTEIVRGLHEIEAGPQGLEVALERVCAQVDQAIANGVQFIVLSDRHSNFDWAPIPSLLLTATVHHHLVRTHNRTRVGLIVEAGDVREVHHVALLVGYGAAAVNPYLVFESAEDLARHELYVAVSPEQAIANVRKALGKGLLKVMSKMGVSTIASYRGAQIFEAIGLSAEFVERYFTGTCSRLGGIGLAEVFRDVQARHDQAYPTQVSWPDGRQLDPGGEYKWRRSGPEHLFDPDTIFRLQHATRTGRADLFSEYSRRVNDSSRRNMTLRSLLEFASPRPPLPLEEVEPVSQIVRRFSTGAMSYGSISQEAHETLAIAMNRLGAKSNTGEGGEDPERLHDPERRSAVKQVASGRFGVTSDYLACATDIQIKMAQGAKPGEGGQLPGPKVYPWVAKTRHSTPGVGLISPPPHHDIYSIEDLKQLIHDLKCANPSARVHVKLVAEVGVGTVAAGVAKAKADVVLISGHDGGTGAAPLTSVKHAGGPWELGLAETQQTLLLNGLRDRIVVQTDGQLKTGRDVMVACLLGAEEFGFATAPLVASGCVMMRACHLDTCPVGVATQNPRLRAAYAGRPEHIMAYFEFVAAEVRQLLAQLGFRSIDQAVGHVEVLDVSRAVRHWKQAGLDLSPVLHRIETDSPLRRTRSQNHELTARYDTELVELAEPALSQGRPVRADLPIRNTDRTVGTVLGHAVTVATGGAGLPDGSIDLTFRGTAGQSFGAFIPRGVTLRLLGDANDYLAKGLSGGVVTLAPPQRSTFVAEQQIIAGNVIAYGATSGQLYIRGQVGERFCVRNSGALAVVEGVGDHALEYMTGGEAVIIGPTGRNLAAGMSGGLAWIMDLDRSKLNTELVDPWPIRPEQLERLRQILRQHCQATASAVAARLLELDDDGLAQRFTTLLPRDYARVLKARDQALAAGLDEAQITEKMMEASHG